MDTSLREWTRVPQTGILRIETSVHDVVIGPRSYGGNFPMEYKTVDILRGGKITARGYVDHLTSTKPQYKRTEPLHVYWIKARIPPV
jgi:hypothetical protein